MKQCSECKQNKPFSEFYKNWKAKDRLQSWCKKCLNHHSNTRHRPYRQERQRSYKLRHSPYPEVVAAYMLHNISKRVGKDTAYLDIECRLTHSQLVRYINKHWADFLLLHDVWRKSNFTRKYAPSIDRINPRKHYVLGNIQIIPFGENSSRRKVTK